MLDPNLDRTLEWWAAPVAPQLDVVLAHLNQARDDGHWHAGDWLDGALGRPSHRLAVYGTLAPGEENHHVIEPAGGTVRAVEIEGEMGIWGRYPVFEPVSRGGRTSAMLVESETLPSFWDVLDEFETDHYARHLVPYFEGDRVAGVTNCYVRSSR